MWRMAVVLLASGALVAASGGQMPAGAATQPAGPASVWAAEVGLDPGSPAPSVPSLPAADRSVTAAVVAGTVLPFGAARKFGSLAGDALAAPVVGSAATSDGRGYWLVAADGGVFPFGDARFEGSLGGVRLAAPVVGMAATADGRGYWLVAADGGVFTFGDARYKGSLSGAHLAAPIIGMAPSAIDGYWLVGTDGGVFAFGSARFHGSESGRRLAAPVMSLAPTATRHGYWLSASDGGVFSFGDATFAGSAAGRPLVQPVVQIVPSPGGPGYWLVEGQRSGAPSDPFTPGLVAALNQRAGVVSAAVLDLGSGALYMYRPGQEGITASIVKVEILGTLLSEAQAQGRGLSPTEQALATAMIEQSDNSAATALWDEVGGAPAVQAFDTSESMSSTTTSLAWGLTVTTASDQVTLMTHLLQPNPLLSAGSRDYELRLMESVEPSQAWGVSAGVAPGATVALKNGWLPLSSGWTVNSIGWIDGQGRDYVIAVLTAGDPTMGYGIDSISMVAQAAWASM